MDEAANDAAQKLIDALAEVGRVGADAGTAFNEKMSAMTEAAASEVSGGISETYETIDDIENGIFEFAEEDEAAADEDEG